MLEVALRLLNKIEDRGFKAYIVGGFVRDYLVGRESNDIDINTNATPKDLSEIFPDIVIPKDDYGSVTVFYKTIRFEITTFRKELVYKDNRRPVEVKYIDDLYQDLIRRDFTINAICMNKDGEIIDHLDGKFDLDKKVIKTIGNSDSKLKEDALRILRAIRFATTLGFSLSKEVEEAIVNNKHLLSSLSYNRKREELDKIFANSNTKEGIKLLLKLGLDKDLELSNLKDVYYTDSLIGIWAVLDVTDIYPFNNNEKDMICSIREALLINNLDAYNLYKYGLYVNCVAGEIKKISSKKITELYNELQIKSKSDILVTGEDIMNILDKEPGRYLKDIYKDIERGILYNKLNNDKEEILSYCVNTYS